MVVVDLSKAAAQNKEAIEKIEAKSGVKVAECYQCGKCSAGCPAASAMDLQPRQVLRNLQLGMYEETLKSHAIWLCAHCHTCVTRCPQNVDLPALMEALRDDAKEKGYVTEKEIKRFDEIFTKYVRKYGKSHEMFLSAEYNLTTGHLTQDMMSAPHMYFKNMIRVRPHKVQNAAAVKKIMDKCKNGGAK